MFSRVFRLVLSHGNISWFMMFLSIFITWLCMAFMVDRSYECAAVLMVYAAISAKLANEYKNKSKEGGR